MKSMRIDPWRSMRINPWQSIHENRSESMRINDVTQNTRSSFRIHGTPLAESRIHDIRCADWNEGDMMMKGSNNPKGS